MTVGVTASGCWAGRCRQSDDRARSLTTFYGDLLRLTGSVADRGVPWRVAVRTFDLRGVDRMWGDDRYVVLPGKPSALPSKHLRFAELDPFPLGFMSWPRNRFPPQRSSP